jgi:hypothetical protein
VFDELFVINRLPCRRHVVIKAFHLSKIVSNTHVTFLDGCEGDAEMDNPRMGLRGKHGLDGLPHFNCGLSVGDLRHDVP